MPDLDEHEYFQEYVGILKQQGRMHEDAALKAVGGDAISLDDRAGEGLRGGRFPTYDIISSTEIASVKSHIGLNSELGQQQTDAYLQDFSNLRGYGRAYDGGLSPIEQDAERVTQLRDSRMPVPKELQGASQSQVAEYLQQKSVMRIPDDHVEGVQEALSAKIREYPPAYDLPEGITDGQIQEYVTGRIKGTRLTSEETLQQLKQEAEQSPEVSEQAPRVAESASQVRAPQAEKGSKAEEQEPEEGKSKGYGYGL